MRFAFPVSGYEARIKNPANPCNHTRPRRYWTAHDREGFGTPSRTGSFAIMKQADHAKVK
jgi:hypothetical protein